MKKWSERRWWHYAAIPSGCLIGPIIGILIVATYQPEALVVACMLHMVLGVAVSLGWLAYSSEYTVKAGANSALAVMEKGSGRVVRVGLQRVRFLQWPFHGHFEAREYPTVFGFSTEFHPITVNPKVVSLLVSVKVMLGEHADIPEWFCGFLTDQASAENAFRLQAFEIFQHRLPQELANRLNPFDRSTVDEFGEFVDQQLRPALPFEVKSITTSVAMKN